MCVYIVRGVCIYDIVYVCVCVCVCMCVLYVCVCSGTVSMVIVIVIVIETKWMTIMIAIATVFEVFERIQWPKGERSERPGNRIIVFSQRQNKFKLTHCNKKNSKHKNNTNPTNPTLTAKIFLFSGPKCPLPSLFLLAYLLTKSFYFSEWVHTLKLLNVVKLLQPISKSVVS